MPHAVDEQELQDQQDEAAISRLLDFSNPQDQDEGLFGLDRTLDVGEKADDAQDFEDIGDDDLADLEDETEVSAERNGHGHGHGHGHGQDDEDVLAGLANGDQAPAQEERFEDDQTLDDLFGDELFGEDDDAATAEPQPAPAPAPLSTPSLNLPTKPSLSLPTNVPQKPTYGSPTSLPHDQVTPSDVEMDMDGDTEPDGEEEEEGEEELDENWLRQKALFDQMAAEREERTRRGGSYEPTGPAEEDLHEFYSIWPTYDPDEKPSFNERFGPVRSIYPWRVPPKPPKALAISKLTLEIEQDHEKLFRLPPGASNANKAVYGLSLQQKGLVSAVPVQRVQDENEDAIEWDEIDEDEVIGGVKWADFQIVCEDWDLPSVASTPEHSQQADSGVDVSHDLPHSPQSNKRKFGGSFDIKQAASIAHRFPSLEDPERATAQIAKRVELDMNDPGLLIDENPSSAQPRKLRRLAGDMSVRESRNALAKDMNRRYNISNDEAYELLKENHQHKVRSTLGSMAVEHSAPATKLQFPFYKVNLDDEQKRSFHRPKIPLISNRVFHFTKPKKLKRKELKGKDAQTVFAKSEDLSMADNSTALLLEYSEEHPVMLSNYGMGSRLINYYRRKDNQDTSRPKEELGETQVLLPQDRSPFANFGRVDPGEIVPTIHNGLYRAPVFKHEARNTDFLVMSTYSNGSGRRFYMRNVENLHIVGQQFPSVEVPGEHSRKVTDAAKRRLRAISYRVVKKYNNKQGQALTNEVVKSHLPGSDIAQNRGKMREFMQYDKNHSHWQLKPGDVIPESDTLRGWIKPEDICVLDSMQVGVQRLKDLGLRKDEDQKNDEEDVDEGANIELQLAPWNTTKNFLNACQGKAMLQLHGEGDPTGRGEGFSFIKTSMKGGFRALGESVEDKLDAKRLKENGGHSYNVAKQQQQYQDSQDRIWAAQNSTLTSVVEHSDVEDDLDEVAEPETARPRDAPTPRSSFGTPAAFGRRDDDSVSQFSRASASRTVVRNEVMYITRTVRDPKYGTLETETEKIENPKVIKEYKKRKYAQRLDKIDIFNTDPTGDAVLDELVRDRMAEEMDRLKRNMDRREARERAKGIVPSPSAAASPAAGGGDDENGGAVGPAAPEGGKGKKARAKKNTEGTARKCANCGQVGHIKTNKKYVHCCQNASGTPQPQDSEPMAMHGESDSQVGGSMNSTACGKKREANNDILDGIEEKRLRILQGTNNAPDQGDQGTAMDTTSDDHDAQPNTANATKKTAKPRKPRQKKPATAATSFANADAASAAHPLSSNPASSWGFSQSEFTL